MRTLLLWAVCIILNPFITASSYAYPGESIVQDANGDYVIIYWNGRLLMKTKFVPANKIFPTVHSNFDSGGNESIVYRYVITNGKNAKQSINSINIWGLPSLYGKQPATPLSSGIDLNTALLAYKDAQNLVVSPANWEGMALNDPENEQLINVSWDSSNDSDTETGATGIPANGKQQGFGFASSELPGIGVAQLSGGFITQEEYEDDGLDPDSSIAQQFDQIEKNDFIPRNAAVPTIAVPAPFDAAVTLDRIRAHVATWTGKQLVEPVFASQLDRYLVAAADAFRRNNIKAGREHLETIHEMLEKEHKNLDSDNEEKSDEHNEHKPVSKPNIDRLAARVLDFDLRYVLKRMERDEDEHKKK